MRGIQLQLSQTQKLRLQKALEQLESLSSKVNSDASVTIADSISVNHEDGVLKGHGTADLDGEVVATLCGVVERVNKLVYVRALRSRYKPEVGDIVIGRVIEVAQKRWRLDINYSQNAYLMLSAMNMPDGVQRRRTALDELNMRCIFEEADVICAEVRGFQHDGLHLQARSKKYGKLTTGQLITVHTVFSEETKTTFPSSSTVWAANAVRVLSTLGFVITLEIIQGVIDLSLSVNLDIHDMLGSEFCVLVAENEAERRSSTKKRR
ncbi:unnamed protein product [Vicia faba]|uniref:RRP4 S1 domain-containing protein n=1 Tax=Vicia faba TaxID=3906 RepID=A0AAV1AN57_VICFA|nr:unnamed protein product [Vicia faba]